MQVKLLVCYISFMNLMLQIFSKIFVLQVGFDFHWKFLNLNTLYPFFYLNLRTSIYVTSLKSLLLYMKYCYLNFQMKVNLQINLSTFFKKYTCIICLRNIWICFSIWERNSLSDWKYDDHTFSWIKEKNCWYNCRTLKMTCFNQNFEYDIYKRTMNFNNKLTVPNSNEF